MAKMRLELDQLSVETFSVLPDRPEHGGTVQGHVFENQLGLDSLNNPSCYGSCQTCPGGATCTCPATCVNTCVRTCAPCYVVLSVDVVCWDEAETIAEPDETAVDLG